MIRWSALLVCGMLAVCGSVQAQESAYVELAQPLRFAVATHLLDLRLQLLTDSSAADAPQRLEAEIEQQQEDDDDDEPPIPLLALFAGSLRNGDAPLLHRLKTDLEAVDDLVGAGQADATAVQQAVQRARDDLAQARKVLIPEAVAGEPALRAALIAKLANSEYGVAEAYEDAAEGETAAYPQARLLLRRINALWAELQPDLPAATEEVGRALDELHALMPGAELPPTFQDPEDAEGAALDIVFALEGALGRPLLIRGFAPALQLLTQQTSDACTAAGRGQEQLALENALAAQINYHAHLASALSTLAPDVDAELNSLWDTLGRFDSGDEDAVCRSLQDAIARAGNVFG